MIPYVSPEDFGAVGDGVTDDTTALQNAVNGAAGNGLILSGTYLISGTIALPGDIEILGTATGEVLSATADISLFAAALESDIRITGVRFRQTATGTAPYTGAVVLDRCTDSLVADCEFTGMQWAGVYLAGAARNEVRDNYFHEFQSGEAGVNEGSDILLYYDCSYNKVTGNTCNGGGDYGILIQDPYSEPARSPSRNLVSGNQVGQHDGYGIAVYIPRPENDLLDTFNSILGNTVEDIVGSHLGGDSGAGIYVVGAGAGGTLIADNTIRNCCRETANRSLAPAAIGLNGIQAEAARVVVSDNDIADMSQGDGILVVSSPGGAAISGNAIRIPGSNGAGATVLGSGIRVENSSRAAVVGNTVTGAGTGAGVIIYANAGDLADLVVTGNQLATAGLPVQVARASTYLLDGVVIAGNACRAGGSIDGMQLQGISRGSVSGNSVACGGIPLYVSVCTNLRISANSLTTTGTTGYQTGGTCTGTFYDLANVTNGAIVNGGTGAKTEVFATAVPAAGTAAVGDKAVQSAPTSGAPDYWRCVTAGSPGTWKAGANLA
jgi:hypothetical protein